MRKTYIAIRYIIPMTKMVLMEKKFIHPVIGLVDSETWNWLQKKKQVGAGSSFMIRKALNKMRKTEKVR